MNDRSFVTRNQATREKLAQLLATFTDRDLQKKLENGWTISMTLIHLAFWDLRAATLLEQFQKGGVRPSGFDAEAFNPVVDQISALVPSRAALQLWLHAAEKVDRLVESLPEALIGEVLAAGQVKLDRSAHRLAHYDEIAQAAR